MIISARDVCKNCDLGLRRKDCSDVEFRDCYELKEELILFKKMLNISIQKLDLSKNDILKILDEIYK